MQSDLVAVFAADRKAQAEEAQLVLTAMDIDSFVQRSEQGLWVLCVVPEKQAQAHTQLEHYWRENRPPEETATPVLVVDSGWAGVIGYLLVIWTLPAIQGAIQASGAIDLRLSGRLQAGAVLDGEVWRIATALTLHADIVHIAGNSVFGVLFGLFVGRYLGSGFGWLLVLLAGCAANLTNALIQPASFSAIGASTATFAALGLVPAFGWRRGYFRGKGWKRGFAPIFGAITLLVFTGLGGDPQSAARIDVLGHIFGFCFGVLGGLIAARVNIEAMSRSDHIRAGVMSFAILLVAWSFAIRF